MSATLDEIIANFTLLDDSEDQQNYLIELARILPRLPEDARTDANKVRGCVAQVWLETTIERSAGPDPRLHFRGDSDSVFVRGLMVLTLAIYDGRKASEISSTDAFAIYEKLGLAAHITRQRSNGVRSMIERIKSDARAAMAG